MFRRAKYERMTPRGLRPVASTLSSKTDRIGDRDIYHTPGLAMPTVGGRTTYRSGSSTWTASMRDASGKASTTVVLVSRWPG